MALFSFIVGEQNRPLGDFLVLSMDIDCYYRYYAQRTVRDRRRSENTPLEPCYETRRYPERDPHHVRHFERRFNKRPKKKAIIQQFLRDNDDVLHIKRKGFFNTKSRIVRHTTLVRLRRASTQYYHTHSLLPNRLAVYTRAPPAVRRQNLYLSSSQAPRGHAGLTDRLLYVRHINTYVFQYLYTRSEIRPISANKKKKLLCDRRRGKFVINNCRQTFPWKQPDFRRKRFIFFPNTRSRRYPAAAVDETRFDVIDSNG